MSKHFTNCFSSESANFRFHHEEPLANQRSYAIHYHPFFPIVPANVLLPQFLPDTIIHESFLLTAALVVASRDQLHLTELHQSIWQHMRKLILDVVLGMSTIRSVGCVEGLLILGEWTPLTLGQNDDGGEGAAWSILGLAVRLAYLLRLEESSFKGNKESDPLMLRRRLAWTCKDQAQLYTRSRNVFKANYSSHVSFRPPNLHQNGPSLLESGPGPRRTIHGG